jgi:hypothetical protein
MLVVANVPTSASVIAMLAAGIMLLFCLLPRRFIIPFV